MDRLVVLEESLKRKCAEVAELTAKSFSRNSEEAEVEVVTGGVLAPNVEEIIPESTGVAEIGYNAGRIHGGQVEGVEDTPYLFQTEEVDGNSLQLSESPDEPKQINEAAAGEGTTPMKKSRGQRKRVKRF